MRLETVNLQTRLDDLRASDERTASTIMSLLSWCQALERAIETQRQDNHRSVDRTADIINGELVTLRTELTAIADKLRGEQEPDRYVSGEISADMQAVFDNLDKPKKSKKPATEENVTQFPAAASG